MSKTGIKLQWKKVEISKIRVNTLEKNKLVIQSNVQKRNALDKTKMKIRSNIKRNKHYNLT